MLSLDLSHRCHSSYHPTIVISAPSESHPQLAITVVVPALPPIATGRPEIEFTDCEAILASAMDHETCSVGVEGASSIVREILSGPPASVRVSKPDARMESAAHNAAPGWTIRMVHVSQAAWSTQPTMHAVAILLRFGDL